MIEGLKFKVTAQEIKEHLQARSQYHENRANEKEAELPTLEALIEKLTGEPAGKLTNQGKARFSGTYGFDPESQMDAIRNDIRHHRSKASKFMFWSSHLFDEDYTLTTEALTGLEMIS
jgi:hypothetical protein